MNSERHKEMALRKMNFAYEMAQHNLDYLLDCLKKDLAEHDPSEPASVRFAGVAADLDGIEYNSMGMALAEAMLRLLDDKTSAIEVLRQEIKHLSKERLDDALVRGESDQPITQHERGIVYERQRVIDRLKAKLEELEANNE